MWISYCPKGPLRINTTSAVHTVNAATSAAKVWRVRGIREYIPYGRRNATLILDGGVCAYPSRP